MPPAPDSEPGPSGAVPRGGLDEVFPTVYQELRRVAHRHLGGERTGHTLGTTALVHEAYLELARLEQIRWPGRAYVLAAAGRAMRRILIDYAVARRAQKRGGGVTAEPLDDAVAMAMTRERRAPGAGRGAGPSGGRPTSARARVVECRFFGGMSVEETAEALETSPATVKRDWTMARAWLNRELGE